MRILAWIKKQLVKIVLLTEFCHDCGVEQPLVWWCSSDDLWREVTGYTKGNGILCPKCFDKRAEKKKISIRWLAVEDGRW
jgi:hypothetical protein